MSRTSTDQVADGRLLNGYDYDNQAWVKNGRYVQCGHPEYMDCGCYGRVHEGQETMTEKVVNPFTGEVITREQYETLRREDTWNHYPEPYPVDSKE